MTKKIIDTLDYDERTGIPFIRDVEGFTYVLERSMPPNRAHRAYLQAYCDVTWANDTDFHSVPCSFGGSLVYTVPEDKDYYAAFLMAAQQHSIKQDLGVSLLGVYLDGERTLLIPFRDQLSYVLFEPLIIKSGVTLEIKYKPFNTKAILGVLAGGFLTDVEV
jgi:hypothetical protein